MAIILCVGLYRNNIKYTARKTNNKSNNEVTTYSSFYDDTIKELSDCFKLQYLEHNAPCDDRKYIEIFTSPWRDSAMFNSPYRSVFEAVSLVIARVYLNVGEISLCGYSPRRAIIKGNLQVVSTLEKVPLSNCPVLYIEQCYLSLKALQEHSGDFLDDREGFTYRVLTTYMLAFKSYLEMFSSMEADL